MSADGSYDLVMPFVTVASNGGIHDDDSYVAGWEMGVLDFRLGLARNAGLGLPCATVHVGNMPQVDLIAMKHELLVVVEEWTGSADIAEEWRHIHFEIGTAP